MGDTLEETPPTRPDKPQSLNINETESNTTKTDTSSRYARNRSRMRGLEEREREREREREHSCDGVISGAVGSGTAVSGTDEFTGIEVPPRRESLNCEQTTSPSALSSSLNKALFGRNTRYPSSVVGAAAVPGTTTRKCVLTLDGYSYVIVASTPENLPGKRDEAQSNLGAASSSGSAGNNNSVGGATQGSSTGNAAGEQSPTSCELGSSTNATINGQVARHGSLTIVRRSNSRKNFTQIDAQQATVVATPSNTASINFFQQLSEPAAERLSSTSRNTNGSSANNTTEVQLGSSSSNKMQPSSPNQTNYIADCANSPSESTVDVFASNAGRASNEHRGRNSSPHANKRRTEFQQPPPDTDSPSILSQEMAWETENLPPVDTPDALNKAAVRLRELLRRMDHESVAYADLQRNLHYAARVLEAVFIDESRRLADEDDELSEVQPDAVPPEVREWLASTFTRQMATSRRKSDEKPKFRSVAHAIRAGIFVDRIYRRVSSSALMQFPPDVVKLLKNLDDWTFDVFALTEAASGQVIKYVAYDLLNRYGIIHKFKIAPGTLEAFLYRVEEGYCRYRNPYHNNLHAVDVMQTMHHTLCATGLMNWLTDLEIFASLLAALIHDYEHTGTTNNFHVMSGSDTALLYNDRAVLENHHVSAFFRLVKDDELNILSHLSREEFREFRTLIIDMVLATDMTFHFQQLKTMRNLLTLQEATIDKSKALSLVLHCCDISHPGKQWNVHHRWTMLLLEEFFRQGDLEKELGLPFSPLCDRKNTLVAESQIGFIEFIVEPSMAIMSDMLEYILGPIAPVLKNKPTPLLEEGSSTGSQEKKNTTDKREALLPKPGFVVPKPWLACLVENKKIWKEQSIKDAEARALAAAQEEQAAAKAEDEKAAAEAAAAETESTEETEAANTSTDGAAAT